jgi:hypothetical protein
MQSGGVNSPTPIFWATVGTDMHAQRQLKRFTAVWMVVSSVLALVGLTTPGIESTTALSVGGLMAEIYQTITEGR